MRASVKVAAIVVLHLLCLSLVEAAACSFQDFVTKLESGPGLPTPGDIDLDKCPADVNQTLANALVSFVEKRPRRSAISAVVGIVADAYQDANRRRPFVTTVGLVQNELRSRDINLTLPTPVPGEFIALDKLAELGVPDPDPGVSDPTPTPTATSPSPTQTATPTLTSPRLSLIAHASYWFIILTLAGLAAALYRLTERAKQNRPRTLGDLPLLVPLGPGAELPSPAPLAPEPPSAPESPGQMTDNIHASQFDELNSRLEKVEAIFAGQQEMERDKTPLARANETSSEIVDRIDTLAQRVEALGQRVDGFSSAPPPPPPPSPDPIALELGVLREMWNKFRGNREIMTAFEKAQVLKWEDFRDSLLFQLPSFVPEEIKPTFDAVLAPARDFHNLVTKILLIPRLLNKQLPNLETPFQDITRVREFINMLTMIQNSNLVADRLNFRLERWVEDQFLSFADLYLQKYQKAQLENDGARLEPGLQIVRRVLKAADLEPIDLTLGITPFDSTRHIGRSTACDSNFANGLILGVVRNGFTRGGQVLRQPEVIVNRVD